MAFIGFLWIELNMTHRIEPGAILAGWDEDSNQKTFIEIMKWSIILWHYLNGFFLLTGKEWRIFVFLWHFFFSFEFDLLMEFVNDSTIWFGIKSTFCLIFSKAFHLFAPIAGTYGFVQ